MWNESVQVGINYTNSGNGAKEMESRTQKTKIKLNNFFKKKSQNGSEDAHMKDLSDVWINMICSSTHFIL